MIISSDSTIIDCPIISLKIPSSVEVIDDYAFAACTKLTNLTIENGVKSIGNSTFSGCSSLARVIIPDSVVEMGTAFPGCSRLSTVEIGNGLTSISTYLFYDCKNLSSVKIGRNIKEIGEAAFMNARIVIFYCYATTPPKLSYDSHYSSFKNGIYSAEISKLYVPAKCATKYDGWGGFSNIIEMD